MPWFLLPPSTKEARHPLLCVGQEIPGPFFNVAMKKKEQVGANFYYNTVIIP